MQNSGMSKRFSYTNTLTFTHSGIRSQVNLISCCTAECGQKQQKGAEAHVFLVLLVSRHQGAEVRGHVVRFSYPSASVTRPHRGPAHFSEVRKTILFPILPLSVFAWCHGCLLTFKCEKRGRTTSLFKGKIWMVVVGGCPGWRFLTS